MNREGKKCVLYPRVSTEMQVDGYSLEGQKNGLKRFADREEMEIVGIYEDAGKSGKSIEGRPAFKKMLSDIKNGLEIDYILVYKLSRFGRNAADILNSLEFVQSYGINLICIEEGIDSSQTSGKLLISVLSAVAEIERENIIEQTMNGRREKARQGGWNGGFAPYGYYLKDNQLLIEETEAEAIRIIFDKFANSDIGLGGVAKYLNLQGIKKIPRQNGTLETWSSHFIRLILDNPVYCGKIAYGRRTREKVKGTKNEYKQVHAEDYILEDGQHEGIISEELWQHLAERREGESIMYASMPVAGEITPAILADMEMVKEIVNGVRGVRASRNIPNRDRLTLNVINAEIPGKPVIIRTLDIGGDKEIPYLGLEKEDNPFLGYRAIRFCLQRTDIYNTQLRALVRASAFGRIKIMVPLVTGVDELRSVKAMVADIMKELDAEGIAYNKNLEIGIMMETPAACMMADVLAKEAAFFSIGTNDLTGYTMAVDRGNSKVAYLYSAFNPAVLRAIKRIIECGKKEGIMVGMCGEAAADPKLIPLLLAFGLDEFSVSATSVLKTRKTIADSSMAECKALADKVMACATEAEVQAVLAQQ